MPFRHPFSTAGEQIMENTSSCGLKLISLLLYRFISNGAGGFCSRPNPYSYRGNPVNPIEMTIKNTIDPDVCLLSPLPWVLP